MLDYRAWIIAGVLLLSAAGAYVIWITRPRVHTSDRSLSAANRQANLPAKPVTTSLHVDGCKDDFIVQPGELIEPTVVPGASAEQLEKAYGADGKHQDGDWIWDKNAYVLTSSDSGAYVKVSLKQGHVLETLDGIELGVDSFGTLFRKMSDRKVEVHERMEHRDGNWALILSMYSSCGRKFRSEYSRTLEASAELDRMVAPRTTAKSNAGVAPMRSDVFMNKVISDYALVPSEGRDESPAGSSSEHN